MKAGADFIKIMANGGCATQCPTGSGRRDGCDSNHSSGK
jgi:hypothetical protein